MIAKKTSPIQADPGDPHSAPTLDESKCRPLLFRAWKAKAVITLLILVYYILGYFSLNRAPFFKYYDVPKVLALDSVPLLPWTILIYNSVFVLSGLGIWLLPDARAARRYFFSVLISYTVNYLFFAFLPTRMERAPIPEVRSLWLWGLRLTREIDAPHTCFPSLHINNCVLATLGLWGTRYQWWFLAWTLAICASTLTTGQHIFLDLPAGAAVALLGKAVSSAIIARRPSQG